MLLLKVLYIPSGFSTTKLSSSPIISKGGFLLNQAEFLKYVGWVVVVGDTERQKDGHLSMDILNLIY